MLPICHSDEMKSIKHRCLFIVFVDFRPLWNHFIIKLVAKEVAKVQGEKASARAPFFFAKSVS